MSKMVLYGGEQDGLEVPISVRSRPDVFYAVPNVDQIKIETTKGRDAKLELRDKLAILAYEFNPDHSDHDYFRMYRNPALDRVAQT